MKMGNGIQWLFVLSIATVALASIGLPAATNQVVVLTGNIDNGTCALGMKAGESGTVDFHSIPYATFAAGASSALPAGTNNGTVQHFSLALTDCHTTAGGNLKPGIQVNDTDYHADDSGDYSRLWRGTGSTAQGAGYLIRFGNISDITAADWWNADVKGNDIPYQGEAGSSQANNADIPFSVVMSCGSCKTAVTGGQVNASLSFTFAYR